LIKGRFKGTLTQVVLDTVHFKPLCLLPKKVKIKIYKTIIFPVVLYGYKTWSLTLKEEYMVFDNRALRRIFGPKKYEIIESLRKLHNEELQNLFSSPNIIRMIK
jgi:hypothetical protein